MAMPMQGDGMESSRLVKVVVCTARPSGDVPLIGGDVPVDYEVVCGDFVNLKMMCRLSFSDVLIEWRAKDYTTAERRRREKINQRLMELSILIPGLKKGATLDLASAPAPAPPAPDLPLPPPDEALDAATHECVQRRNGRRSKMEQPFYTSMMSLAVRAKAKKLDLSLAYKDLSDAIVHTALCGMDGLINMDDPDPSSPVAIVEAWGVLPEDVADIASTSGAPPMP